MTSLKETIIKELLDSVGDPAGLEAAFKSHKHSKGPFYLALAEATSTLSSGLENLMTAISETQAARESLDGELHSLKVQRNELQDEIQVFEEQLDKAETNLENKKALLERVDRLSKQGFGTEELDRLYQMLAEIASSQGAHPHEGVGQFFETVEGYEQVLSLDLETQRAKAAAEKARAEAEKWSAEAGAQEARCKARGATIDLVERLVKGGLKEKYLREWSQVVNKAGLEPETLRLGIELYGSMEALNADLQERVDRLHKDAAKANASLKALKKELSEVTASIAVIRDGAVSEIDRVGSAASDHLERLLDMLKEYGELQSAAEELRTEVAQARAIRTQDPRQWGRLPRQAALNLMIGLIVWSKGEGRDYAVAPPELLRQKHRSLSRWHKVALSDLLLWALEAMVTDEERTALAAG